MRHRNAKLTSRASGQLYTTIFFNDRNVEEEAVITDVRRNGISVIVPKYAHHFFCTDFPPKKFGFFCAHFHPKLFWLRFLVRYSRKFFRYGIEEPIYFMSKKDLDAGKSQFSFDEDTFTISRSLTPAVSFCLFDRVRVSIFVKTSKMHRY